MSYTTLAQVQGMVPLIAIGSGSVPSSTQVQQYIDARSGEIDSALAALGFQTPIAAPADFVADLAQLNATAAAGDVWLSTFISAPGVNATANGRALLTTFDARLAQMRAGIGIPVGLGYTEQDRSPRSYFTDNGAIGSGLDAVDVFGDRVCADPPLRIGKVY